MGTYRRRPGRWPYIVIWAGLGLMLLSTCAGAYVFLTY